MTWHDSVSWVMPRSLPISCQPEVTDFSAVAAAGGADWRADLARTTNSSRIALLPRRARGRSRRWDLKCTLRRRIPPPSFVAERVHRVGARGLHRLQRHRDVSDREAREGRSDEDQRVDARAEREVLEPRFHHEIGEHARDHGRAEHEVDDPVREQGDDLPRARAEHFANADLARALRGHEGREAEQAEARDEDTEPGEDRYQAREPRVRDVELLERVVEKLE